VIAGNAGCGVDFKAVCFTVVVAQHDPSGNFLLLDKKEKILA